MKNREKKRWPAWKVWIVGLMVLIAIAVLFGLAAGSTVEIKESEVMKARPEKIHARLNSFKPWREKFAEALKKEDPTAEVTLSGPDEGVGATVSWTGEKLGSGRVTITQSDPAKGIWYEGAIRSDDVNVTGSVTFERAEEGTKVTADLDGDLPPVVGGFVRAYVEDEFKQMLKQALGDLKRDVE